VVSSANPSAFGQSVTFTATVSAGAPGSGTPTGTVSFLDGASTLGTATLSSGSATLTTGALAVGGHAITVVYGGDTNFSTSTSGALTQVVNQDGSAIGVVSSANPSVFGQSVTFTATVTAGAPGAGTPTGTVAFLDGATTLRTGTLSGGTATFTTGALAVGGHPITVVYSGDTNFTTSTTSSLTQTVNHDNSSTAVVSSVNPTGYGQSVTFTATVTASAPGSGTPTGTVTFKDGAATLGTGTLSGGTAAFTTSALAAGGHTITVAYGGDTNFGTSTSGALTQTVNKDGTTTAVVSSVNPSVFGQGVTFTATVTANAPGAGTPTGTVIFKDGAATLGTGTLSGGTATLSTSALAVGGHTISVVYAGDTNFAASTIPSLTQTVNKDGTASTVVSSLNPSVFGQSVTFTATVSAAAPGAGTPTGTVTFKDGGTTLGTASLSGGKATLATSALAVGSHSITVSYAGDGNFTASASGALTQAVNKAGTTSTVVSSLNPSVFGQSVTFTATVSAAAPGAGTPTGTVTFKDGATTLGTASLSGGKATLATSALAVGSHSITVSYAGDANFSSSASGAVAQTVKATSSTVVTSSVNPSTFGQSVTFTATVSAGPGGSGTPTGTVTFLDGATTLGTASLSGGKATLATSALLAGGHSITVSYGGDANFGGSTSATLNQTVNKDGTASTVVSSLNPSVFGQLVTFTATVSAKGPGSGTPTGTVTFKDGGTTLATVSLSGGIATFSTSTLAVGNHAITVSYSGDSNFNSSASSALKQTVLASSNSLVAGKLSTWSISPSVPAAGKDGERAAVLTQPALLAGWSMPASEVSGSGLGVSKPSRGVGGRAERENHGVFDTSLANQLLALDAFFALDGADVLAKMR
jgi:hypothetical protein